MRKSALGLFTFSVLLLPLAACGGSASVETTTTVKPSTTSTSSTLPPHVATMGLTVPGLSKGDCYQSGSTVTQVDCEELHDGQVIQTGMALDSSLTLTEDVSLWQKDAEDKCSPSFKDFVGYTYDKEDGRFLIAPIIEDASTPTISCAVVDADGKKWAGTAENFIGSYESVRVGDCFLFPTNTNDAIVVNCTQPHDGEMFINDQKIGINSSNAPYPTEDEWDDIAFKICEKPFTAYTGKSVDDTDVSYSFTYPLQSDWYEVSQRTLSCVATSGDGRQLSYSLRK